MSAVAEPLLCCNPFVFGLAVMSAVMCVVALQRDATNVIAAGAVAAPALGVATAVSSPSDVERINRGVPIGGLTMSLATVTVSGVLHGGCGVLGYGVIELQGGYPPVHGWKEADMGLQLLCSTRSAGFRGSLVSYVHIYWYTLGWPNWTPRTGCRRPAMNSGTPTTPLPAVFVG